MIKKEQYGRLVTEEPVFIYTLSAGMMEAGIISYGATLVSLKVKGVDVILGYDSLQGYVEGNSSQGATIGRYANRIAEGRFSVGGSDYSLDRNEESTGCHIHGGVKGFSRQVWELEELKDGDAPSLTLNYVSPDGDQGYPGELCVNVTFTLTDSALDIRYHAVTDKPTICNLTNHSYFNLAGRGDCLEHSLQIFAGEWLPVDESFIPLKRESVKDTVFDFTLPKAIGCDIDEDDPQLSVVGGGYDHNYILGTDRSWKKAAVVFCPETDITMTVSTDLPGIQLYTSNMLCEPLGKYGMPLVKHQALCLETQFWPDSPNHSDYPSCALMPGEEYDTHTEFSFTAGDREDD
ncbi:MAG: galactose mutarotase [Abditibacteriota bacterium]|nr:galactose mutarotase [Abditibacteriota bacterium]